MHFLVDIACIYPPEVKKERKEVGIKVDKDEEWTDP